MLINLGSVLMSVNLTDVCDSRQTFPSIHRLAFQIENLGCHGFVSDGGARKVDGCLNGGYSKGIEYGVTLNLREGVRHYYKMSKGAIWRVRGRNTTHLQNLGDSSPSRNVSMLATLLPSVHNCYGGSPQNVSGSLSRD